MTTWFKVHDIVVTATHLRPAALRLPPEPRHAAQFENNVKHCAFLGPPCSDSKINA